MDSLPPPGHADWIRSSLADDEDFAEILHVFVEEMPETRSRIEDLIASSDFDSLRREAHKLRGSAGGYGFQQISALAGILEESCKNCAGNEAAILQNVHELLDYLRRVRA